jgi:F0F1-type ATP synthase membrane subunit b/b'
MNLPNLTDPVFIAKVLDFIIFVGAIVWVWNKWLVKQLVAHQETQNKIVADAQAHRSQSEAAVTRGQAAIEQAKIDAVRMVQVGQAQAAKLVADERVEAHEHAQRILAHASGELERERYRVRRELLEETVEQAHTRAQELAKRVIDPPKQDILVDRLIADLERARA